MRGLGGILTLELDNSRRHRAPIDYELPGSNGKLEAARPGAPRVYVQNAVALLNGRPVRVAGYDDMNASGAGLDVKLREVVDGVDEYLTNLQELGFTEARRPWPTIVVASYGGQWCQGCELLEDAWITDIASVDDVVATAQEGFGFRSQETVRVGNETHAKHG
jgi:hypothetical protein